MKIKDIMIRDVTSVLADCKLYNLLEILSRHRVTGAPVVNNEQEVIGFISQHDVIEATLPNYLSIINSSSILSEFIQLSKSLKENSNYPVENFMRKNVITVDENDNEVLAADLLIRNKVQRLPVVRNKKLVGIITLTDICRVLIKNNKEEEKN
ncbi:MAG: CBS domain-containing protein [Candidatus Caldatribacteriota bacterium]|nr:CBS domain-containing protein [Candidatus Caldatribacteriota bacterium]